LGIWRDTRRSLLYVELLVDLEQQFDLEHLLFKQRKCRTCGRTKDLLNDFYLTRKNRSRLASAYSYECKICTIERVVKNRKDNKGIPEWSYPDW